MSVPSSVGPCDDVIIDATGSYGSGGKPWSDVQWKITSSLTGAMDLNSFLNQNCTDVTNLVTIPNKFLFRTNKYTLYLTLTNVFGISSSVSQQFHVMSMSDAKKPQVSILGPPIITRYRWQTIQLKASAQIVQCGVVTPGNIDYDWKFYQGFQLLNTIYSKSIDPRTFLLDPYTLLPNKIYTVQVVASVNGNLKQSTTELVKIDTGLSGVVASIAGGSKFTTSNDAPFTLDASGSYDIDFPSGSSLTYIWQCVQNSPNFGAACPSTIVLNAAAIITIPSGSFIVTNTQTYTYMFTVFVQNSFNASSSSSVFVTLVKGGLASAVIQTPTSKFNANSKILLSASIIVPSSFESATASWNTTSIPSSVFDAAVQGNPVAIFFANTKETLYLVLAPGYLSAGATYSFSLTIVGTSSIRTTTAQCTVTVVMNSPPVGGFLTVTPPTGTALQTVKC